MLQSLYSAANGMISMQGNIDTIANNIANINTDGYKRVRTDFRDALYQRMISPVDNSPELNLQRGTGALTYQTMRIFEVGKLADTGRTLDLAIDREGFFSVENPRAGEEEQPDVLYTRSGSLYRDTEGYLVTPQGYYVLDDAGGRIAIPLVPESDIMVSQDGSLSYQENGAAVELGVRLGLVNFPNPAGLSMSGENMYIETVNSGPPEELYEGLRQGYTEQSNVDYAEQVSRLIRAQRAYQLAARCVTTTDQMEGLVNSIRQ